MPSIFISHSDPGDNYPPPFIMRHLAKRLAEIDAARRISLRNVEDDSELWGALDEAVQALRDAGFSGVVKIDVDEEYLDD